MCGLFVVKGKIADTNDVLKTLYKIKYRGPDNTSVFSNNDVVIGGTGASRNIALNADGSGRFSSDIYAGESVGSETLFKFTPIRPSQTAPFDFRK